MRHRHDRSKTPSLILSVKPSAQVAARVREYCSSKERNNCQLASLISILNARSPYAIGLPGARIGRRLGGVAGMCQGDSGGMCESIAVSP